MPKGSDLQTINENVRTGGPTTRSRAHPLSELPSGLSPAVFGTSYLLSTLWHEVSRADRCPNPKERRRSVGDRESHRTRPHSSARGCRRSLSTDRLEFQPSRSSVVARRIRLVRSNGPHNFADHQCVRRRTTLTGKRERTSESDSSNSALTDRCKVAPTTCLDQASSKSSSPSTICSATTSISSVTPRPGCSGTSM